MNRIYYLLTALRLRFAARRAVAAKNRLTSAIHSTREETKRLKDDYERFLILSEKQERMAVRLKRLNRLNSDRPILNHKTKTGDINVVPIPEKGLTDFDIRLALVRHKCCDWGELPPADWRFNNEAVKTGKGFVISRYPFHGDGCLLVKTELERQKTCIRLEEKN